MTYSTTRPHDDAFARMVGALSTDNPLGSTVREWDANPDRFPDAVSRPWNGPVLRCDAESHELSADARRISRDTLIAAQSGRLDARLLRQSLGSRFRLDRVLERAATLHFPSGTDIQRAFRRTHHGATAH
jgi:hypothetical protein